MDLASLIGFVFLSVGVFAGMIFKGADPVAMFTNVAALLIVWAGSIGAVVASHSVADNLNAMKAFKKIFFPGKPPNSRETVSELVSMAQQARKEGLLGLEERVKNLDDPFLKKGVQMAVDGTDATTMHATLTAEVKAMKERHKTVANWFTTAGIFAPTFGIIGAVVGLIAVLGNLDDPSKLGHGIAAAFVATFWGVFLANGMFLPWGNRLKRASTEEAAHREITIQGIMALQGGMNPRAMHERLSGYLPPKEREDLEAS